MSLSANPDVVIAGGGMAGVSVAAALQEFGYRILVVEPGLDGEKRLAGELVHPPGITALEELGLLSFLEGSGAVPVGGFAIFPGSSAAVSSSEIQSYQLSYAEVPGLKNQGLALEHSLLRQRLFHALESLPHVTHYCGRISAVNLDDSASVGVTISSKQGSIQLRTGLLVAADGGSSSTARMAGIRQQRARISTLVGYLIRDVELPHPGFAHVFLGGPGIVLAYAIGPDQVRLVFDVPDDPEGARALESNEHYLDGLPATLRRAVRPQMKEQSALASASFVIVPEAVVCRRLVLVGDAGGCCHPLTATGLSVGTRDALRLRNTIREANGDVDHALQLYGQRRRGPERTRLAVAAALYNTFSGQSSDLRLLRDGLIRYWSQSPSGRAASMALLSTCEERMAIWAREYAKSIMYGLAAQLPHAQLQFFGYGRVVLELSLRMLRYARGSFPV